MQFAMGFEFGVLPPEFFPAGWLRWFLLARRSQYDPDPTHPISIQLLYSAIDNILETYKGIDWIWLWLNEHSFMGVDPRRALQSTAFRVIYDRHVHLFSDEALMKERNSSAYGHCNTCSWRKNICNGKRPQ